MIIHTHAAEKVNPSPAVKEEQKAPIKKPIPRPKREEKQEKVEEVVPTYSGLVPEEESEQ